jgi:hypothetical protein
MRHRIIPVCLAAIVATLFALPASAWAGEWKAVPAGGAYPLGIKAAAGVTKLTGKGSVVIECSSATGTGQYSSATKGSLTFTLSGCVDLPSKVSCTSAGQVAGTIVTETLPFSNPYLKPSKTTPGMLLTPNLGGFAVFQCGSAKFEVEGNGIIGDLTSPKCGETSTTATVDWESSAEATQKWMTITEDPKLGVWDSKTRINGGSSFTSSLDSDVTLTYAENTTVSCT